MTNKPTELSQTSVDDLIAKIKEVTGINFDKLIVTEEGIEHARKTLPPEVFKEQLKKIKHENREIRRLTKTKDGKFINF